MSGKKVYELAKEFDVPSKEFATLLQTINIPVKNHMSVISEQQEKYFRNNFKIEDEKIVPKSPEEKKPVDRKKSNQSQSASKGQSSNRSQQQRSQKQTNFNDRNNRQSRSDSNQRDGRSYTGQRSDSRQSNSSQNNRSNRNDGNQYNRNQQNRNQQNRNQQSGNQQGRPNYNRNQNSGYVKDKDGDDTAKRSTPNRPRKKPIDKPAEKPNKIEVTKKENKMRTEKKKKAKENFFKDDGSIKKLDNTKRTRGSKRVYKKKKQQERNENPLIPESITIPDMITVGELAAMIQVTATEIIKILFGYGMMVSINQSLDFDTAAIVCEELGISIKLEEQEDVFEKMYEKHFADQSKLKERPPIITVMGHVDHGKTSLLDSIRNTDVISGEAGGITQHIGAYTITPGEKAITFIDTPGHEAFTSMRSRGASVTDIAILVIAADDGIKPQTIEAIDHAKAAEVPIIVAVNKIDKPEANPDKVKQELTEYGLVPEEWGGETICVNVSAKTGEGIDNLLDMILLVAEVEDLKANFEEPAIGTILEARVDKQRGITASVLITSGNMNEGDVIVTGSIFGRVRAMTNDKGKRINNIGPSTAAEMLGFNEIPEAGDKFFVVESEKEARKITDSLKDSISRKAQRANAPVTLDELFNQISEGELKELKLVVKADVQGSLEALKQSLAKLNENEDNIKVSVIHAGIGAVNATDISLAAASNALVIAFNVRADNNAKIASAKEEVEIRYYRVIYNILEEIQDAMKGMLEPEFVEVDSATAEVRQTFRLPNSKVVAGSYVTSGTISRKDNVRVVREGIVVFEGELASLKRVKDDVKEVASGYECGIMIDSYNDVQEGDILEFYHMEEVKRS